MDIVFILILGILCGALVNYLADVLPTQRKLSAPTCPNCGASFNFVNYLIAMPCRACRAKHSIRHYLILAAGVLITLGLWLGNPALGFTASLLILTYFGLVAVIDIEHRLIMHSVSLAGAILFAVLGFIRNGWSITLSGGLVGGSVMLAFYLIGIQFAKYRAKKLGHDDGEEALGFGDVTISAVLGLLTGWPDIMLTLLIGVVIGGLFSLLTIVVLFALRRYHSMTVFTAYGPFLIIGATMMVFFREPVLRFFFP
jgi:leader peptidase (prepilin peptidase)/N-methyltransferase